MLSNVIEFTCGLNFDYGFADFGGGFLFYEIVRTLMVSVSWAKMF